jgi:hypothetical protein
LKNQSKNLLSLVIAIATEAVKEEIGGRFSEDLLHRNVHRLVKS